MSSRPYVVTAEQWKESAIALEAEVTRIEGELAGYKQGFESRIALLVYEISLLRRERGDCNLTGTDIP